MIREADVAIVGSGFSGAILAMIVRRLGHTVLLLERGRHPRFAIGESSTPLASLLLEELAQRYDLPRLLPLTKFGRWRRAYPEVACGLKRGFSFFHHERGAPFAADPAHRNQLLVAASPRDEIGDVHWYRPDFDHFLVREAQSLGVEYLDELSLASFESSARGARMDGRRKGEPLTVRARFVIDATGPRGFLHRALHLDERTLPGLPATQTLYTHFGGVRLFSDVVPRAFEGVPPYPVDDAAVHHVFDGGWIWVLRFVNGITSAGVAVTDGLARELRLEEGAAAWQRLMSRFPSIGAQFASATPMREFTRVPRLSFFSAQIAGDRWVMLPSAAGVVDPLLSTGFPLTLLGVGRVADIIERDWDSPRFAERLRAYAAQTASELESTARLVGALYGAMDDFERFAALTFLYFAAASYTEAARRLHRRDLAGDAFLLGKHPVFAPAFRACLDRAGAMRSAADRSALLAEIARAIEPVNVAGLARAERRNWYPVAANDLLGAAHRLQAGEPALLALLERCGFSPSAVTP